ncbi:MAG: cation diffusion facilitator family transporter [Anaerolineae bacterium]|jgi:cobalt-zinc-cadmium efflux system protein|nr:cation diffusion facilitator family transporter [Anaerolineae bacterium]
MSADHDHGRGSSEGRMWLVLGLTTLFLAAEVAGGIIFNSLALLSDAAHMATDAIALAIAIAAIRLSRLAADRKRTFGYHRFEVLGAALNAAMLFVVAVYIGFEAWQRWRTPLPIDSWGMLLVACAGLAVNLIGMRLLAADAGKSLNVKGAYLEVWADALGSVAVIVGALLVWLTGWTRADPVIAVFIALWVLPRAWTLFRQTVNVLLEGVPDGLDLGELERSILSVDGVAELHELHVWALGSDKNSLTVHVIVNETADADQVGKAVREAISRKFGITHSTVQMERRRCDPPDPDAALHR